MTDYDLKEEKIQTTKFFIEATSCEQFYLWKEFKNETLWEEDLCGFTQIIGYIDNHENKPVNVAFTFAKIYGQRICFYEVVSRYSDSVMVENWIKENYPKTWDNGNRIAITNATNFHHAIDALKE